MIFSCSIFDKRDKTLLYDEFLPTNYLKIDSDCNKKLNTAILYKSMYSKLEDEFNETTSSFVETSVNKQIAVLNYLYSVDSLLDFDENKFEFYLWKNKKSKKAEGLMEAARMMQELENEIAFGLSSEANIKEVFIEKYNNYKLFVQNSIVESEMVAFDNNSKTYKLRFYNSNIDEEVLIKFIFNKDKDCISYQLL